MRSSSYPMLRAGSGLVWGGVALAWLAFLSPTVRGQAGLGLGLGLGLTNRAVGGVSIDTDGILQVADPANLDSLRAQMEDSLQPLSQQAQQPGLRKISLKRLEQALQAAHAAGERVPDDLRFLAGLQRVEYVLADPAGNDILLAGPGEPWRMNPHGIAVGQHSGKPVVLLDDLLIALRSVHEARLGGITCSIDPRPEGLQALSRFFKRQKGMNPTVAASVERLLGPQSITVQGVSNNSHFARVLVAADFKMKRIAMQLDPSPIDELTSYLAMLQQSRQGAASATPRWWLACNYDAIGRGSDGLSWSIRGVGVKAMTETETVDASGRRTRTGTSGRLEQKWADTMTDNYTQLAAQEPIFGQLRNVMDLCVVAALLEKEGLYDKTACPCSMLRGTTPGTDHEVWTSARQVASQCSIVQRGRDYIISASGGVQIGSWQVLDNVQDVPELESTRASVVQSAAGAGDAWWWN